MGLEKNDSVVIGNGGYIEAHAMILGNVAVGDNAMIGTGAIVLYDVEPNATYINPVELMRIK